MRQFKHVPIGIKSILIFMLAFLLSMGVMQTTHSLIAYAVDGNGEEKNNNGDLPEQNGKGYPGSAKSGWLAYLYRYDTGATPYTPTLIPTGNLSGTAQLTTVFGVPQGSYRVMPSIPKPFTTGGAGNGAKVKNGLITEGSPYYWAKVVEVCWGEAVLQKVKEEPDKYYLVMEVVACHAVTPGEGQGGNQIIATAHNWAEIDMAAGKPETGDGHTGWCDNAVAPTCAYLASQWEGLPAPPTVFATSKLTT